MHIGPALNRAVAAYESERFRFQSCGHHASSAMTATKMRQADRAWRRGLHSKTPTQHSVVLVADYGHSARGG